MPDFAMRNVMSNRSNRRKVRIEFGNCDPLRIVYYPNYVVWIDQSTHHLFESVGLPIRDLQERLGVQLPLVDLAMQFAKPAGWGDDVEIESQIERWGTKSFDVAHRITNAATGDTLSTGRETRVCVRINPGAAKELAGCPIPEEMRKAFGQLR
jgi:4-hydroxybenzoyl-CoA thioesterase